MTKTPKSYLEADKRETLLLHGGEHAVAMAESRAARRAGDKEAATAWLKTTQLSAESLLMMKLWNGADYIRNMGFSTDAADKVYGSDWLDREA